MLLLKLSGRWIWLCLPLPVVPFYFQFANLDLHYCKLVPPSSSTCTQKKQRRIDNPNFPNLSLCCCLCKSGVRFCPSFLYSFSSSFSSYSSIRLSSHRATVCLIAWPPPPFFLWRPGNLYFKLHRQLVHVSSLLQHQFYFVPLPPPSIAAVNFTNKVAFNLKQHISLNCRLIALTSHQLIVHYFLIRIYECNKLLSWQQKTAQELSESEEEAESYQLANTESSVLNCRLLINLPSGWRVLQVLPGW